jgi:hypothetical protein
VTVVVTIYLLGVGWRWVVVLLALGTGALVVFTLRANGQFLATARADLVIQAVLALASTTALVVVHHRAGHRWTPADRNADRGTTADSAAGTADAAGAA